MKWHISLIIRLTGWNNPSGIFCIHQCVFRTRSQTKCGDEMVICFDSPLIRESSWNLFPPPPVKYCSFITPEEWNIQNLTSAISARRETERSAQSTTITTRPSRYLTEMEGRRDEGGQTQRGKRGECDDKWAVACGSSALIMVSGWKNTQAPHRLLGDNGILRASDTAKDRDEIWK